MYCFSFIPVVRQLHVIHLLIFNFSYIFTVYGGTFRKHFETIRVGITLVAILICKLMHKLKLLLYLFVIALHVLLVRVAIMNISSVLICSMLKLYWNLLVL